MVMAYGVVHLGILPQFFSAEAVDVLKDGSTRGIKCEIKDVTDVDVKQKLLMVKLTRRTA